MPSKRNGNLSKRSGKSQKAITGGDSKIPGGRLVTKAVPIRELRFAPIQELRLWLPGRFVTLSSSAASLLDTVVQLNDVSNATYGAAITTTLTSVFKQMMLLHTRISLVPQMETGTNQQANVLVGVDCESATAYASKNAASQANTFIMPVSNAESSVTQFTYYQRSYDELVWAPVTTSPAAGQRAYMKLYGDSTTGLGATKTVLEVRLEFFVALRGLV